MKQCGEINLKLEIEKELKEVNFLNTTVSNLSGYIGMKWWQNPQRSHTGPPLLSPAKDEKQHCNRIFEKCTKNNITDILRYYN